MAEDKIHLLSEALCNLVRAQEVVSNPAAAVKELLDNAIDAGATKISLDIKAGGKEYIHVTDNGSGMSPIDARMAFERHATSKLRSADDLEKITTLGFRGEGLASIATVANVVLKTRREEDELGTEVLMSGGNFAGQKPVVTAKGTSILMSEVFYNVPGRRRSLKKDETEERAIDNEFNQCVLAHPSISFSYYKAGELHKELRASTLKERIVAVAGRNFNERLLPVTFESPNVCITGFISQPDVAVQRLQKQYFFVNGRYIKHDYFRKAVETAYEGLIPSGHHPHFFLYFTVPTENVDINIHPSKKEVRFVDEPYIWGLLKQLSREALSANLRIPMIDWDRSESFEIPAYQGHKDLEDTFAEEQEPSIPSVARRIFLPGGASTSSISRPRPQMSYDVDWQSLSEGFQAGAEPKVEKVQSIFASEMGELEAPMARASFPMAHGIFQGTEYPSVGQFIYKGKYIVSSLRRSLLLVDLHRAHCRVLFDAYYQALQSGEVETQELMFPEVLECGIGELSYVRELIAQLEPYGFVFEPQELDTKWLIKQAPTLIADAALSFVANAIAHYQELELSPSDGLAEYVARALADTQAYSYGTKLDAQQIDSLISKLFTSSKPSHDPHGRIVMTIIDEEDIDRRF